ncbi:MAG: hypothetical protein AAB426_05655 [Myxococcota bacterium]
MLSIALAMLGCGTQGPAVDLHLAMRLPLTAAEADYAEISATQGDTTTRVIVTGQASGVLQLYAGMPARIEATVFTFVDGDAPGWYSYEATHLLTPQPGTNDVAVELQATASAAATFAGRFEDGTPFVEALHIEVVDRVTGFVQPDAFLTGQTFAYPAHRAAQFRVVRPDDSQSYSWDTVLDGRPTDDTAIPLGTGPALSFDTPVAYTNLDEIIPASALGLSVTPPYTTECTAAATCAAALIWRDCGTPVPLDQERPYEVCARYVEIPGVVASSLVHRDLTPPVLRASITPSYVTGPTTTAVLTLDGNEELAGNSPTVGSDQATVVCNGGAWTSATHFECPLQISSWIQTNAPTLAVQVTHADLAGNAANTAATLRASAAGQLDVIGVSAFPTTPDPSSYSLLLAVDVINTTGADLSNVTIQLTSTYVVAPDQATTVFTGTYGTSMPAVATLTNTSTARLWFQLTAAGGYTPVDGEYTVYVSVSGYNDLGLPFYSPAASFPLPMARPTLRWLGSGPLVVSTLTGTAPLNASLDASALPYVQPYDSYVGEPAVDDPARLRFSLGEGGGELFGLSPGTATLTLTDPSPQHPASARIDIEVAEPPTLLALKADRLVRRTATADVTVPIAANIGTPRRVLWESSRDATVVVGTTGVAVYFADGGSAVHAIPCGAVAIRSAALTDARAERGRADADMALLVEDATAAVRYCEIDPISGDAVVAAQTIPLGSCAGAPTELVVDPLTGVRAALTAGCISRFVVTAGTLTGLDSRANAGLTAAPSHAVLDAYGAAAIVLTSSQPPLAGSWGIGLDLPVGGPFVIAGQDGTHASAIAVDPLRGAQIIAGFSQASASDPKVATLFSVANRFGTNVSATSRRSTALGSLSFDRLAVDASHRLLYAADNGVAPALWTFPLDSVHAGSAFDVGTRRVWLDATPVVDLAIAGPQALALSPSTAEPGALATIAGLGFAGRGRDEVFVNGLAAQVLGSSTTAVQFRVPPALNDWPTTRRGVFVTVRSHGRLSGPVLSTAGGQPALTVEPARPYRAFYYYANSYACTAGDCTLTPQLVPTAGSEIMGLLPSSTGADFFVPGYSPVPYLVESPDGGLFRSMGGRILGVTRDGTSWLETNRLSFEVSAGSEQRRVDLATLPQGTPHIALSPSGELVALARGNSFALYALSTLEAQGAPQTSTVDPIGAVAFTADGQELVLAGNSAALDIRRLAALGTAIVPTSSGSCSYSGLVPLDMQARADSSDEVAILFGSVGSSALSSATLRTTSGGGKELYCRTSMTLPAGTTVDSAVLSPTGAWTYVTDDYIGYSQSARLYTSGDFDTMLSLASLGYYLSGVETAISTDDSVLLATTPTYSYFFSMQDMP